MGCIEVPGDSQSTAPFRSVRHAQQETSSCAARYLASFCGSLAKTTPLFAAGEKRLYSFCSANHCSDGQGPAADFMMDKAGNLYGTTENRFGF